MLKEYIKPNVRKMFVPDPGYIIFDADLKQSDAQVMAWDANDEGLKQIFREERDLHVENAKVIYSLTSEPTKAQRQWAKHGVHATNYGANPRTMAYKLGMTIVQATRFQERWFELHPAVKEWHEQIETELMETRTIRNIFGYRRIFFGRVEGLLPEALAWKPQSTTTNIIDKGLNNIDENLSDVELMLQVHDSLIGQFKEKHYRDIRAEILKQMQIIVPYEDPLIIGVDIACSRKSWGDCVKVDANDGQQFCPH